MQNAHNKNSFNNIGEALEKAAHDKIKQQGVYGERSPRIEIPDLKGNTQIIQSHNNTTIVQGYHLTHCHRIVFVLVCAKECLQRATIAGKCELSLTAVSINLHKLKKLNIVVTPQYGYYAIAQNYLYAFELAFGKPKAVKLHKMFDEAGVDPIENIPALEIGEPEENRNRIAILKSKLLDLQVGYDAIRHEQAKFENQLKAFYHVLENKNNNLNN